MSQKVSISPLPLMLTRPRDCSSRRVLGSATAPSSKLATTLLTWQRMAELLLSTASGEGMRSTSLTNSSACADRHGNASEGGTHCGWRCSPCRRTSTSAAFCDPPRRPSPARHEAPPGCAAASHPARGGAAMQESCSDATDHNRARRFAQPGARQGLRRWCVGPAASTAAGQERDACDAAAVRVGRSLCSASRRAPRRDARNRRP